MKDLKSLSPFDYLRILWRRRWYALAGFVLICAAASFYAWRRTPVYTSTSRIKVESAPVPQDYVRPSVRSTPEDQIAAVRSAVQSRSFLQRMVQDFQLFGYGTTAAAFSMEDTIKAVSRSIEIVNVSPDTFQISFSAADPQLAQNLTRRIVETIIQTNTSSRRNKAIETDQFLDDQLRQAKQNLAAKEEEIRQFKMSHLGELPEQTQAVMNALNRLDVQLASVENALDNLKERKKLLGMMAQNQSKMSIPALDSVLPDLNQTGDSSEDSATGKQLLAKQAELDALRAKYTPQYPDVVRLAREVDILKQKLAQEKAAAKKADELTALGNQNSQPAADKSDPDMAAFPSSENLEMESVNNDIKNKEKERAGILDQMKKLQSKLNLAPAMEQQLSALSREHDTLSQQYASLQGKKFQAQMTTNLETNEGGDTYRVVDDANLPEDPNPPTRIQIVLLGIGAGLVFGIGAALGREILDPTLGSEDEVAAVVKLPILATVSEIPKKGPKKISVMRRSA